ncbi:MULTISPECIES: mycofactocin-coupled SDR family oxidoreductase [Rhodococcus]|uniref:mycofactocin-coupled SDR family oxidoreductase n=1 Tax=Rhodococcus TaxID=1827 RepID=UPI00077A43DE|nr:mycofactocin-coupled SDR family oxidoreductase [Rhodococcus sp. LB1]KXX57415.1 3-ketoacyl-ACP reductase [Rhodococcus sp. LB1]
MGRVAGKVAFITGAARGQGRSHAIRLAEEGADIIAMDIARDIGSVPYGLGTAADLAETARQVEALGRRVVIYEADVRDYDRLESGLDDAVAQLGRLDIVSANAGILSFAPMDQLTEEQFDDLLDVNLKGAWHTAKAAIPHLRGNKGGSIILTSSASGISGAGNIGHYSASKHGMVGLTKSLALELGVDRIRVNSVHPTSVDTKMIQNDAIYELFMPDVAPAERTRESVTPRFLNLNVIPIPWVEAIDVSNAVLWLASDESRYVTGHQLTVDAGQLAR